MMARTSRRRQALALCLLLAPLAARAQLSNVPDLSTATEGTTAQTTGQTTQTSKGDSTATGTNGGNDASDTAPAGTVTNAPSLETDSSSAANGLQPHTGTFTDSAYHLTGIPTLAGVGIPTLYIPYTANAPFMQKSSLPEGTFFIAVGAVLAFLGACVLLWRGMVAWSINRSVKRTALASMQLNEKQSRASSYWRSGSGNNGGYSRVSTAGGGRGSFYKDLGGVGGQRNISLENLTAAGGKPKFRDSVAERHTSMNQPPPNLFFSPTAHAAQGRDSYRSSGYMPSGYYASAAAQTPAGGHTSTTIGGLAPGHGNVNRYSAISSQSGPSPPESPSLPPQSRGSTIAARPTTRDGLRGPGSRGGDGMYAQPSSSSLAVGSNSVSDLAGSRAPSAYLEELMDNHGHGPRERF